MNSINDISVRVEERVWETGNLQFILAEIHHALEQLNEHQQEHSIDLQAMPFAPGEEEKLLQLLGHGEVEVELNTLGKSTLYETAMSGVWKVTHFNTEGNVVANLIEITTIPKIICSPREALQSSIDSMKLLIKENSSINSK